MQNPQTPYVSQGMPELDMSGRSTSFFEFWPLWLMYIPVVCLWLVLGLRYRSFTLPLIANPAIPLSGMVGVSKTAVFRAAGATASKWILPWMQYTVSDDCAQSQLQYVKAKLAEHSLGFPLVGKPDIGCRGVGVRLLHNEQELLTYLSQFPVAGSIQFQRLAEWEPEAGVFYVRYPGESRGRITSLTLKYTPYVVGNGVDTLSQLIAADPRAEDLMHLYRSRHTSSWDRIIPQGEPYRLIFAASHSRGAIFRDGAQYISEAMVSRLDEIFKDIPGFYYGRLDIKFRNLESLSKGEDFSIIEINGASSESIHIWDRRTLLLDALGTLLKQYKTLFEIGSRNRVLGHKTPKIREVWQAWRYEANLVKMYPEND